MKKVLLTLTAVVIFFFTSCKKEAANTTDTTITTPAEYTLTAQNVANIDGVKNLSNQDQKRLAFRLLSPIEKYGAWIENVRIISANFTPQQKLLTVEMVAFITPQLFNNGNNSNNGQAASLRDAWLKKAQKVFTSDQIRTIAYTLFSTTDKNDAVQVNMADMQMPSCNCTSGSNYSYSCAGDSACHTADDMQSCKSAGAGCGFCWIWPCDNTCIVLPKAQSE